MKTYLFILMSERHQYIGEYETRCRTLTEAQSEFRHYIRKQIPYLLDSSLAGYVYTLKVTP